MEGISNPKQNTAATRRPKYKCLRCERVFDTSNALGGHQNAHRIEGGLKAMSPVLAAVLSHPIPLDDDDEPTTELGLHMGLDGQGDVSMAGNGSHRGHPNVNPVTEESPEENLTKDLLGEWVLMNVERSPERTFTNYNVRVSEGHEGGEVTSNANNIDLELKLGF
ncbi:hypothetical protein CFOL_v3_07501 [Cephalotus follicularis]|uniref:C2H2-type domain-containing protein n=1 Tax=Cephalotus follicularis TaxID=3775 RepID=A0A1Q3B895_CEPFO|nr:hypothetical protein CFOL_v3_07501 [Cephalotus follicularis]